MCVCICICRGFGVVCAMPMIEFVQLARTCTDVRASWRVFLRSWIGQLLITCPKASQNDRIAESGGLQAIL